MSTQLDPRRGGRHASAVRSAVAARLGSAALVALVVLVGLGALSTRGGAGGCPAGAPALAVAAAPELAPALAAAVDTLGAGDDSAAVGDDLGCLRVAVNPRSPADVAAALRSPAAARPDVWIPDSSVWPARLAGAGVGVPRHGPPVALSPVVLAVPARTAGRLGPHPDFTGVLGRVRAGELRLGLPDPDRSAASVGAVLGVQAALPGGPAGRATLAGTIRAAHRDLPADLPRLLAAGQAGPLAVPASEQAVRAHNAARRAPVVAVYPPRPGMTLDYPYLVLATAEPARAAAGRLLAALRTDAGRARLRAAGFRDAGSGPPASGPPASVQARAAGPGAPVPSAAADPAAAPAGRQVPSVAQVEAAARTARVAGLRSRLLAVIDVSGSMGQPVTGAAGRTRLGLTTEAAGTGLALFPDDTEVGLWVFATGLANGADHRQLVPVGPLAVRPGGRSGRELLAAALAGVRHVPGGSTGLYDTALAAVRAVRAGWTAGRVNAVVLFTDGRNADATGVGLADLLRTLRRENDPRRPVPVLAVAYGPDADVAALRAISGATGGELYQARDPRQVYRVFLDAIGHRLCRPAC